MWHSNKDGAGATKVPKLKIFIEEIKGHKQGCKTKHKEAASENPEVGPTHTYVVSHRMF